MNIQKLSIIPKPPPSKVVPIELTRKQSGHNSVPAVRGISASLVESEKLHSTKQHQRSPFLSCQQGLQMKSEILVTSRNKHPISFFPCQISIAGSNINKRLDNVPNLIMFLSNPMKFQLVEKRYSRVVNAEMFEYVTKTLNHTS